MRTAITASLQRRTAVAIASAALAASAACSDAPVTGPSAAEVASPNASLNPPVAVQEVTIRLKDINGNLIQEGMIPVEFLALTAAGDTVKRQLAYDNHLNPQYNIDLNTALGIMTIKMPMAAKQRVCLYNFSSLYAFEMTQPHCNEVTTNAAYKVDAGSLVMRKKPIHTFYLKDWFGMPVVGGKIHVKGPLWYYDFTFEDGGFGDVGAPDGKIEMRGEIAGMYEWCEVAAPSGYLLAKPTCGTLSLNWEGNTSQSIYHVQNVRVQLP
jgi:hypothetical protein